MAEAFRREWTIRPRELTMLVAHRRSGGVICAGGGLCRPRRKWMTRLIEVFSAAFVKQLI